MIMFMAVTNRQDYKSEASGPVHEGFYRLFIVLKSNGINWHVTISYETFINIMNYYCQENKQCIFQWWHLRQGKEKKKLTLNVI